MPRAPEWWDAKGWRSALLLPASALYGAGARLCASLTTPEKFPVSVICVGNAVAGGAGKTPVALRVAGLLAQQGKNVWCVSRGYGGVLSGPVVVDASHHTAAEVGDEPLLLSSHRPTVVAKDRAEGIRYTLAQGADAVVLDDGFQNRRIAKDLNLLVVDGEYRFGNGRLLPAGPLREPVADAVARADAVVQIGGEGMLREAGEKPVFRAALVPDPAVAAELSGKDVVAFAGIGRPEKFHRTLEDIGCRVRDFIPFPDHHPYTDADLESLCQKVRESGAVLVTTEKDAARLSAFWREKVTALPVTLTLENAEAFETLLRARVPR